jgi:hypothetical protein
VASGLASHFCNVWIVRPVGLIREDSVSTYC